MPMLSSPDVSPRPKGQGARRKWVGQLKAKTKMTKPPDWVSELARVAVPLAFVSLVAAAVAGITTPLFFAMVLSAGLVIVVIRALFPAGRLFPIAFASLIAVYAAIFSLFVEEIFRGIDAAFLVVGFCLPIFLFVVGCWLRRDQVRAVVAHPAIRSERRVMRAVVWLVPVFFVGASVILLSRTVGALANMDMVFLGAMTIIGLIVLTVSREVAIFLVDAGLLFEEFFSRVSRLVIPAFAFFTFYSLIVILFASAYRLISVYTPEAQFNVGGALRGLSFSESIYFSINTISTVGYGDIIPYSNLARVLSSLEVFCGIMLLLFGVSELLEYAREHRRDRGSK
jgi:voltage-gated potassium channel